ncbi:MAG TPA: homoserine kinase [Kofleriaceae bacterium]|nr:homoserine kinase [Kofleriaceae bacterium]
MGVFTQLDHVALAEIAAAFELGALQRGRAIAAGTVNTNIELVTDRGHWFLRVNEGKTEEDVAWEARLVAALAERGVATPAPLVARDGRPYAAHAGKWVSAFPWRAGHHVDAAEVTPPLAEALGAQLAQLHLAGLSLPEAWRRPSIYDHAHLVERYAGFHASRDPELARAIEVLGEELDAASAAAAIRGRATTGIIHGDLFRDNVLWADGRIAALLDFEQASGGSLAYDLAVCINDWCWTGGPRADLYAALLAGYRRVRELAPGDREALPVELRAAAARFTITRITDVYLAGVDNPEKDFRAFLARCDAWRGPSLGELTSLL